ncbi:MAG: hypothetical protein Q8T09_23890 [Candidatus Melainabacteria bacterium]|nr:hypothetical protein [Candidatus Melainabacteria bacterium]
MTSEILTPGWQFYGLSQEHYAASMDKEVFYKGSQSARLEATSETAPGSAGIHQIIDATKYRNKRIRFTAFIKTRDVEDRCGLYLSVSTRGYPTELDDMSTRPIKGTIDWQQFSVVINLNKDSRRINFGAFLAGTGTVWLDGATLEIVGDDVASTNISRSKFATRDSGRDNSKANENLQTLPKSPMNMDFESA